MTLCGPQGSVPNKQTNKQTNKVQCTSAQTSRISSRCPGRMARQHMAACPQITVCSKQPPFMDELEHPRRQNGHTHAGRGCVSEMG